MAGGGENVGSPLLAIVMPVFNEQETLGRDLREWFLEVSCRTADFVFLVIDDGSTDGSLRVLRDLREELGPRIEIFSHANRGHGQTCLEGYRMACGRGARWVLQLDSDGQCDPQDFQRFWSQRDKYDVIYGVRARREDGWRRVVASGILRWTILVAARVWCVDANVPYRLMKTEGLVEMVDRIPGDFFLGNVALAVILRRAGWREGVVRIRFRARSGGEPSVPLSRFGARALELIRQLGTLR
jgi:dolichol-phosphate mannosyltransferase